MSEFAGSKNMDLPRCVASVWFASVGVGLAGVELVCVSSVCIALVCSDSRMVVVANSESSLGPRCAL